MTSPSLNFVIVFVLIFAYLLVTCTLRDPEIRLEMRKFFDTAKSAFDEHNNGGGFPSQRPQQQVPMQDGQSQIQAPTQTDIYRYRYHHGANLGSVFVLERWLTGHMFKDGTVGSSELAAVEAWVDAEGIDATRQRFEKHWREYVSDEDLDWLRDNGKATTVRLPIGYWDLGPPHCEGTPFRRVAEVYQSAWPAIKDLVRRCHARGIAVLIDMHGLPGGANAQDHSGTNSNKAELWQERKFRDLGTRALCFIAQQARNMEGVAGLQIINEAEHDAKGMYEWYASVLHELSSIDPGLPVYVSDAWDLHRCAAWTQGHNTAGAHSNNPVVVDTHLYWCFSDADKAKSPQQITQEAHSSLSALDGKDGSVVDHGAAQAIVGEYSCVLFEDSWGKGGGAPKDQLVREFGTTQSQRYQHRAGGAFFWTYKMDWMPGGEWGFRQMTNSGAIVPPHTVTLSKDDVRNRVQSARGQHEQRRNDAHGAHCHYWDSNHPGQYEHQRFASGFDTGFSDAMAFFGSRAERGLHGGVRIGMLDLWVLKRLRESGPGGRFVWEWEQGFRQGVGNAYQALGI